MSSILSNELIAALREQFQINWKGAHGAGHLARVYENGLYLAEFTHANPRVVELFAVFHDSRRLNESQDPKHGRRGAYLAQLWRGKYFDISDDEFDLLFTACLLHTNEKTHQDTTIQTCFDADRLDLARVGILPDPRLLCTEAARKRETIAWATQRSTSAYIPDNLLGRALKG